MATTPVTNRQEKQKDTEKRERIVRRIARELRDGFYVNLGIGMPTLVANYVPEGMEVILQSENGMLGVGPFPYEGQEDAAELPSKDEENEGEGVPAPRRERGRQKQARSSREADEDANAEVTAADAESQDENDDVEDFSHWNVPSWNELIAALYRPQR